MRRILLLLALAACGGKIERTGSERSDVAALPPAPSSSSSSSGGGGSADPTDGVSLDGDFSHMAADATSFYLAGAGGRIVRVPKAGGPPVEIHAGDEYFIEGLAVDDTHVYWSRLSAGEIVRMPKEGGTAEVIASGQVRPWDVAVDADRVYWASQGDAVAGAPSPPPGGQIASVAKTGGPVTVLAPNQVTPNAIALGGDWLYFGGSGWGDANGTIKRVPRAGGAIETIATRIDFVQSLTVAGGWVAWVGGDRFAQAPVGGGQVLEIVPQPNHLVVGTGIASDGASFYFGVEADVGGEIIAADVGSASHRTIARPAVPSDATHFIGVAVAVADSRVFWLDSWWSYAHPSMHTQLRSATP